MDVGVFQHTSVTIDIERTINELENFWSQKDTKIRDLARMTEPFKISVVYSDVNAISAFFVEKKAELPQFTPNVKIIASSNFTWDWIYSQIDVEEEKKERLKKFIDIHRQANAIYDLFLILPFNNEEYFEQNMNFKKTLRIDGLFPTPQSEFRTQQIRSQLIDLYRRRMNEEGKSNAEDVSDDQLKFILYSFGGFPFPITEYMKDWRIPKDWIIIWIHSERGGVPHDRKENIPFYPNVLTINELDDQIIFNYVDILASVDVVVIKTGFGVVSEVICNRKSTLYVDRPGFAEHHDLVKSLKENVSAKEVSLEDVMSANLFTQHIPEVFPNTKVPILENNVASHISSLILEL